MAASSLTSSALTSEIAFPLRTGTTGTADAVNVVLGNLGQIEVDHLRQFTDVDTPGGDVGGDQDPDLCWP